MKRSDINEPLLSDFNEKDDNEANPSWVIEEDDGKKTKYNLDDPVTSDYSDKPPDEDDI
ncbi:hypothetical protein M9Y10_014343 [Tritrichomonas musculus]|uniref:Uncharacterized protein n=1 Tax=Tritrichomonas musculus TaxID=1915356 RepID=A0ABR2KZG6_9EUKA